MPLDPLSTLDNSEGPSGSWASQMCKLTSTAPSYSHRVVDLWGSRSCVSNQCSFFHQLLEDRRSESKNINKMVNGLWYSRGWKCPEIGVAGWWWQKWWKHSWSWLFHTLVLQSIIKPDKKNALSVGQWYICKAWEILEAQLKAVNINSPFNHRMKSRKQPSLVDKAQNQGQPTQVICWWHWA